MKQTHDVRVCPKCGSTKAMRVVDSGIKEGWSWIYRRRECQFCKHTVSTFEIASAEIKLILDKNERMKQIIQTMASYSKEMLKNEELDIEAL